MRRGQGSILHVMHVRCLLDIQEEMSSWHLDVGIGRLGWKCTCSSQCLESINATRLDEGPKRMNMVREEVQSLSLGAVQC